MKQAKSWTFSEKGPIVVVRQHWTLQQNYMFSPRVAGKGKKIQKSKRQRHLSRDEIHVAKPYRVIHVPLKKRSPRHICMHVPCFTNSGLRYGKRRKCCRNYLWVSFIIKNDPDAIKMDDHSDDHGKILLLQVCTTKKYHIRIMKKKQLDLH